MDITEILSLCVSKNVSDLHLSASKPVMARIDGGLVKLGIKIFDSQDLLDLVKPLLSKADLYQLNDQLDLDIGIDVNSIGRLRLHLFYQITGLSAVIRFIPEKIPSLSDINMPACIYPLLMKKQGLILITGATGSGKSTTLASIIQWLNTNCCGHVITLEDPIEFIYTSNQCLINQRQVGMHIASFSKGLKSALREDPDYIVIGELRDIESIRFALTAAETGHLVFASLHTNNATKTIDRLVYSFGEKEQSMVRMMLSESLTGVISQQLIKRKANGRIALFEILIVNQAVSHLIREHKTPQIYSAIQTGRKAGMQTFEQATNDLYLQGLIDINF
ncbi:PilT/PilU family type 4a pilus ATPase [Thiotrichales bacterium 19S9-12]|nr:PilT/PilU family type 4a pilus ATPase [Thiotrichales bacterium 19S9-11]MCF6810827.1 PilT/PilU family type 4a pilus ATPase [Thiotrichales bacterium 19S9-12]